MYKNSNKQYYIHIYIRRETHIDIAPDVQFLFNIHMGRGGVLLYDRHGVVTIISYYYDIIAVLKLSVSHSVPNLFFRFCSLWFGELKLNTARK